MSVPESPRERSDARDDARPPDRGPWDGERVRGLRRYLGETQAQFAARLGTRQQTISEWETGGSRPRGISRRLLHLVAEERGYYATDRSPAKPGTGKADRDAGR